MANARLRAARMRAHSVLDPIWKNGRDSRKGVYAKLKACFGHEIHIGESDEKRCAEIINVLHNTYTEHFL